MSTTSQIMQETRGIKTFKRSVTAKTKKTGMAVRENKVSQDLYRLKFFYLPAWYAATISVHACVKESRKHIGDSFWNKMFPVSDTTGSINLFRFCLPLLVNWLAIYAYNYLKRRFSAEKAFYIFNGACVSLFFLWYVGPVLNADFYRNGRPVLAPLLETKWGQSLSPWLKAALANVFETTLVVFLLLYVKQFLSSL